MHEMVMLMMMVYAGLDQEVRIPGKTKVALTGSKQWMDLFRSLGNKLVYQLTQETQKAKHDKHFS